jgi:Zn-dependent protease with chaperone function
VLDTLKTLGVLLAIPLIGYFVLGWVGNESTVQTIALWTAVGSVLFLLLITLAGAVCRVNRKLLLLTFTPGLYISNLAVAVAVILQGVILMATVWYGESALIGRVHVKFLLFVAIGAAFGAFSIIKASFGIVHRAKCTVIGHAVKSEDRPRLWNFANELAKKTGTEPPHNLVIGLDPNFFVTEADVQCLDGWFAGRTMYISAPLCRILTIDELTAILAHEYGHFRGSDTQFSLKFYPIYRGAFDSLQAVAHAAMHSDAGGIVLFPAIHMLTFFLDRFSGAEKQISRERELAADAVAAQAAGPANIATGLVKVVAFSGEWPQIQALLQRSLTGGKRIEVDGNERDPVAVFSNLSELFSGVVGNHASPESLNGLDSRMIPHPTDSHPPLSVRLKALGFALSDVAGSALKVIPETPASSLIDKVEELEVQLSMVQQYLVNLNGGRTPAVISERVEQTAASEHQPEGAPLDSTLTGRRLRTLDDTLRVFQDRNFNSTVVAQLPKGADIQLGAASEFEGREWLEAKLADGTTGYVLGPTARSHTEASN